MTANGYFGSLKQIARIFPWSFIVIQILSFLFAARELRGEAPLLRRPEHPNHYILLIDSSGSAVSPWAKRQIFQRTLIDELIPRLYESGFGNAIPAFDPGQDLLSLLHFGIVTGPSERAYLRLARYDLLTEMIHPSLVQAPDVQREDLAGRIMPHAVYQFSALSWARPLALAHLRSRGGSFSAHRTFLLFVHDGQPNDHTVQAEDRAIEQFSRRASYELAATKVGEIQKSYFVSDSRGGSGPAWSLPESSLNQRYPIFLEAYEVVLLSDLERAAAAASLKPFERLGFRWMRERGHRPQGVLEGELSDGLRSWMAAARLGDSTLRAEGAGGEGRAAVDSRFLVPIAFGRAAGCKAESLAVRLELTLQTDDPLLGTRTLLYSPPAESLRLPPPLLCTTAFWLKVGAAVFAGITVLGLLIFYVRNRLLITRLRVWLPGQVEPLPLARWGSREAQALVTPKPGLEALRLDLPARWRQALFHEGATLTLDAAGSMNLRWSAGEGGSPTLRLPVGLRQTHAFWESSPAGSVRLTLTFRQGRQRSDLILSYPSRGV